MAETSNPKDNENGPDSFASADEYSQLSAADADLETDIERAHYQALHADGNASRAANIRSKIGNLDTSDKERLDKKLEIIRSGKLPPFDEIVDVTGSSHHRQNITELLIPGLTEKNEVRLTAKRQKMVDKVQTHDANALVDIDQAGQEYDAAGGQPNVTLDPEKARTEARNRQEIIGWNEKELSKIKRAIYSLEPGDDSGKTRLETRAKELSEYIWRVKNEL